MDAKHYVASIEEQLDAWATTLGERARELEARLAKHRKRQTEGGRRNDGYRSLMLSVNEKGNSLEIRWQKGDRAGPRGQKPKNGLWLTPLKKMAKRDGNGYHYEVLRSLATEPERDLIEELEREARAIRAEHADIMAIRRGLTTIRARERHRAKKEG